MNKPILKSLVLAVLAFWITSCTSISENDSTKPLGSKENPVRCDGPAGEREYLNRLVGPNGEEVLYYRVGSFGQGPDGHILDGYDIAIKDGEYKYLIFMDMYHPGYIENDPIEIKGFRMSNVEQGGEADPIIHGNFENEPQQ